jgi:hypothetical protein
MAMLARTTPHGPRKCPSHWFSMVRLTPFEPGTLISRSTDDRLMIPCCSRADLYNVNELDFTFNIGFTLILSWEVHKYTHIENLHAMLTADNSMVYTLTHVGTGRPNLHALHCSRRSRRQHVAIGSMQPLLAAADLVAQRLPMCGHTRGSLRATILPCAK